MGFFFGSSVDYKTNCILASYGSDCQIYGLDSSRSGKEYGLEGRLGRSCQRWGILTLSVAIPFFLTCAANLMNANDLASSMTCMRDPFAGIRARSVAVTCS